MTTEKDIVLIHMEGTPLSFARVEKISPDIKPDWYHIRLLLLQVPLQQVTWILRDSYIEGEEFTMSGKKMRLERIVSPPEDSQTEPAAEKTPETGPAPGKAKVISLKDLKKDR